MENDGRSPAITPGGATITAASPVGAFVNVQRTERQMTMYAFTEAELSTIGVLNVVLNVAIAVAGIALGAIVTLDLTTRGYAVAGVTIMCCIGVGVWSALRRNSEVERVKRESRIVS
jgi:hypothetical protein